jgi:two-component system nitrogen regulation response regulator NtrX
LHADIIGRSAALARVLEQVELVSATSSTVLVSGETGTGKELIANAIHYGSFRKSKPMISVNCGAIPRELMEREFFGHVKGAYTGATDNRKGYFQQADGGTLFLDEVGDMSPKTQAKVLRVLEEQRFAPVGSNTSVQVDVRVIASTNKDLEKEIEQGNFREDLYYRLNVIPFQLPALRERKEDVEELACYFLEDFANRYGRKPPTFTRKALEILECYPWPGNVRELRNMMERFIIMRPQQRLDVYDLPEAILQRTILNVPELSGATSLQNAREKFEREFILKKLVEHKGNVSRAAQVLQIERSHLYRKMRQLGIPYSGRENGDPD